MDTLKIHLLLNYYPAIGMVFGTILIVAGYWLRSERIKRGSLKVFVAVALFTFPAYVTGEIGGAQNRSTYTGPYMESLQKHKDAARPTFLLTEVVGVVSLLGLILLRRGSASGRRAVLAALTLSLISSAALLWTVLAGRQVKWSGTPPAAESSVKPAR